MGFQSLFKPGQATYGLHSYYVQSSLGAGDVFASSNVYSGHMPGVEAKAACALWRWRQSDRA